MFYAIVLIENMIHFNFICSSDIPLQKKKTQQNNLLMEPH